MYRRVAKALSYYEAEDRSWLAEEAAPGYFAITAVPQGQAGSRSVFTSWSIRPLEAAAQRSGSSNTNTVDPGGAAAKPRVPQHASISHSSTATLAIGVAVARHAARTQLYHWKQGFCLVGRRWNFINAAEFFAAGVAG